MISITTKVSYPKTADKKKAYQLYLKNTKKKIKAIETKGKKAEVHFSNEGEVITTSFKGNGDLVKKIQKVMFGK